MLLGRWIINESAFPDRLVGPLLLTDSTASADAIVVLGGGVTGGCVPNLNSMRRTVRAARLLRDGRAPWLVITGGLAGGSCPVADGMSEFARELGVPADRIVVERESRSTWENGARTTPLLRELGVHRILLVTDRLHMRRAAGVFARHGFVVERSAVPVYEGHADNVSMLEAGVREAAALAYYRLRQWTTSTPDATVPRDPHVRTPMTDAQHASLQPPTASTQAPIVLLGAWYAANWPLTDLAGVTMLNRGVAGEQSHELLERFDRDVVAAHPRAVVLWGFINDIFRASDAEMAAAQARIRDSFTEMIRRARAAGIEPVLATEVTIRPRKTVVDTVMSAVGWVLGKRSNQDRVNELVTELNQWLRETGQRERLLVLDLQRVLADGDGPRKWSYAVPDGSHISPAGYDALTAYARPLLLKQFGLADGGPGAGRE